jgi:predicted DNA-binding ribbon-helix-helix protein
MSSRSKALSRGRGARVVRQSVSIPAPLAAEVRRVAKERQLTMSRALVTLAERGVRAEQDAKENLKSAYRRFLKEKEPSKKEEAGRDMIRAIFGKDSIAEDSIL